MRIDLAFTPFLPYPDNLPFSTRRMFIRLWKWRTNLSGEQFSEPRHVWTASPGGIRKDMCERKAYPHKVCPDRNRIRLRVNKFRKSIQIHMNAIPIRWHYLRIEWDNNYPDTCEQGLRRGYYSYPDASVVFCSKSAKLPRFMNTPGEHHMWHLFWMRGWAISA